METGSLKWIIIDLVMLVLVLMPEQYSELMKSVWPLAMASQMGWFAKIGKDAVQLKAETGTFPWHERMKAAPFAIALVAFAYVALANHTDLEAKIVGSLGVLSSVASKLWLARSPIGRR